MTSREIIIKLIDEKKITGEQAVILLNDIIVAELCEAQKVLDQCKSKELKYNPSWISSSPNITYTSTSGRCISDPNCGTTLSVSSI